MGDANMLSIVVEDDDGNRSVVALAPGEVTLGRGADNTVTLPDRNISRHHAKLVLDAAGAGHVEDLGSYNGVVVNGTRIEGRQDLRAGDVLRLGDVQLELRSNAAAPMADESTERHDTHVDGGQGASAEGTEPGVGARARRSLEEEETRPNGSVVGLANERTLPGEAPRPPPAPLEAEPTAVGAAAPTPPFAKLLCLGPPRTGVAFELSRAETVFGRTGENHVALDHPSISRQHAIFRCEGRTYAVRDAGSANGTFVNGTGTQGQTLKFGDVIELGHVRLRLVAPEELAALTPAEQAAARDQLRPPSAGSRLLPLAGAAAAVVLGLVGTKLYLRRAPVVAAPPAMAHKLAVADDGPDDAAKAASKGADDEAQSLLAQARQALKVHQYSKAGALANAVLALAPAGVPDAGGAQDFADVRGSVLAAAQALVNQADAEGRGEQGLSAAKKAVAAHAWPDAFNALQNVPKGCSFAAEADALMGQVRPALVKDRLAEAKESADGHDWDEVELLVQEVAGLQPDPSEQVNLAELRQLVEDGRAKHAAKVAPPAAPVVGPSKGSGSKAGHSPRQAHGDGERRTQGGSDDAKLTYAEGTRALGQGQLQRAIDSFNRCLVADKSFAMCYRALGIAYAKSGNGAKAARFYRLYLKVDPNARDAQQVRTLLQQYDDQPGPGETAGEHTGG